MVLVSVLAVAGCARLAIYKNEELQGPEAGIKFHYAKPYLLVARTGNKDKPVEVSVIYLPDLANPMYAKLKTGYGSADLSLGFQNGMLTNVGQKTDTKIPETITAFSGLAAAAKPLAAPAMAAALLEIAPSYQEISNKLKLIAEGLSQEYKRAKEKKIVTPEELDMIHEIEGTIKRASSLKLDEDTKGEVVVLLKMAIDDGKKIVLTDFGIRLNLKIYLAEVQDILDKLSPKVEGPTVKLYEIVYEKEKEQIKLKLVDTSNIQFPESR